jgi:hypothetical protein
MVFPEEASCAGNKGRELDPRGPGTRKELVSALVAFEMKLAFSYFVEEKWLGATKKMIRKPLKPGAGTRTKSRRKSESTDAMDSLLKSEFEQITPFAYPLTDLLTDSLTDPLTDPLTDFLAS